MIYFDNAATTPMSDVAIAALLNVSKNNFGNASSIYSYGKVSKEILLESREIIAKAIGAKSCEIYFTSCGTESDNWAIAQAKKNKYASIITSTIEHHAILNSVKRMEEEGYETSYIPVDSKGVVCLDALKEILGKNAHLVSIMFQNNETGVIQPIREVAEIVHSKNSESIIHTDAVQAVGHFPINVKELDVDILSASAHKFNGPKGVGFLYAREGLDLLPLIYGGGQEQTLRSGTENIAGIYSMAKALEENTKNIENNNNKIAKLESRLLHQLNSEHVCYEINGNLNRKAAGVINISFDGVDGEGLLNTLDAQGIFISTGSACNSKSKERSHVLRSMGIPEKHIDSSVRISIGVCNTETEIDTLAKSISRYSKLVSSIIG